MLAGDVIDLPGVAPSLVSDANGTITTDSGGGFALGAAAGQPGVSIVSDKASGALITLGGEMACLAQGTRLLTPNGYVPVEAFKPGDPIITRLGIRRPVRWIGRRRMQADLKGRQDMRPVVVLPGALGPLRPGKPVRLSPSHAVFVDGVLVPVMHLVNGATILREKGLGAVSYFHIELDRHDVLMAEGLEVESYLDTGNRGEFHQELGIRGNAARPCAPLVTNGPKLACIRRRLHEAALRAGFSLDHEPHLRGIIGETMLTPELRRSGAVRVARFLLPLLLPPATGRMLLRAKCAAPADTDPDSDDRRELALCLHQPRAVRQRLLLGDGWYPKAPGDAGIWMSGSGEIFLPPGIKALTLRFSAVAQGWRCPANG
jgi:Hint domain